MTHFPKCNCLWPSVTCMSVFWHLFECTGNALIRHYFFIPPILKGRYMSHTCVCRRYLWHTCVCRRYLWHTQATEAYSFDWGIHEYAIKICGKHEYDSCISLWEWEEWKNNVFHSSNIPSNIFFNCEWYQINRWKDFYYIHMAYKNS